MVDFEVAHTDRPRFLLGVERLERAPALVALSTRVGRLTVLRTCLAGNAIASLLTASASGYSSIAVARTLAGLTAASVPVAQGVAS